MEFWPGIECRCQIFVSLEHCDFRTVGKPDHCFEAIYDWPHHVVKVYSQEPEYVHYHCCGRSFSMASCDNDPFFVFGLFVEIFRERHYFQSKFTGTDQFGVITTGMHTEYDSINFTCYIFRIPALFFRQKAIFCQSWSWRLEDLIIRSGHMIQLFMKGDGEVMHHRSTDSNEMYPHLHITDLDAFFQWCQFVILRRNKLLANKTFVPGLYDGLHNCRII